MNCIKSIALHILYWLSLPWTALGWCCCPGAISAYYNMFCDRAKQIIFIIVAPNEPAASRPARGQPEVPPPRGADGQMESGTDLNLLDEKFDLKYINQISSDPTRASYVVHCKFVYLHGSSDLQEICQKITGNPCWRSHP